jgi:FolB domain-containing protein
MIIRIKNLRLRTMIGIQDWERRAQQDIIINIEVEYDGIRALETDQIEDTVNYKNIKRNVMQAVENSHFSLLDKLAGHILKIVMGNPKVLRAVVEVDKPQALRFADSVSVICSGFRNKNETSFQMDDSKLI